MNHDFERQLLDSFFVHTPLKADENRTMEHFAMEKKVLRRVEAWDGSDPARWSFDGEGKHTVTAPGELRLTTWPRAKHWPESETRATDASAGAYATFGSYVARLDVRGLELTGCNRIRFSLYCDCPGMHSPIVRAAFVNNGEVKIPDVYSREGFHAMNLKNHQWNTLTWEIDSIAHDNIEELSFTMHRYGKELSGGDELRFTLRDICLEQVETPDVKRGWQCQAETAVFSTSGYWRAGTKTAVANTAQSHFQIVDDKTGAVVCEHPVQRVTGRHGEFALLDFTSLQQAGNYRIRLGNYQSEAFAVSDHPFDTAVWRLLNFLYCERCGYPVPGKHGTCHLDVVAEHNGVKLSYAGGWHDAADVSQQTVQTAEILHAVLAAASSVKDRVPLLYERLMEEANWGLDYILRTRFGDGYRATNSSIRRWTDNLMGNMDDCEANVHNHSFENFLCAGVEAYAARSFAQRDTELAWKCAAAAQEDFAFALERFRAVGLEEVVLHEHAASAGLSQYYAAACWAGAELYAATEDAAYAEYVAEFAGKLINCQETGAANAPMQGFFYQNESKVHIVHFSHQARDQIFVQALEAACRALPEHPEKPRWEEAMRLFGTYLKALREYTEPYGMLPAGLYAMSEVEDATQFARIHPSVEHQREKENYRKQLENAIPLGSGYYIRCFPVWFSFRGNSAIHLSMGKAASLLGRYFGDTELMDIAREQLYWTLGKNPMGQSLIYGEGSRYGQQYTALLGETVGEMPVGIQTLANEDLPYWPPANIATYREVWTTPPGRWLWIAADVMSADSDEKA